MSEVLVSCILGRPIPCTHDQALSEKVLAIGSLLHCAAKPRDIAWGTGTHGPIPGNVAPHLDVRAVRGPLTRAFLRAAGGKAPMIYGDPALLLPRYLPYDARGRTDIGLVPHYADCKNSWRIEGHLIDVRGEPRNVVQLIADCKRVITSSLHGLIVADAYGIPATLARGNETERNPFKFVDYFASVGRDMPCLLHPAEAVKLPPLPPPQLPDLDALIGAFPFDAFTL